MPSCPTPLYAEVLARYASIHAFCRAHPELKRSTVYMVLKGRYSGNAARQEASIHAALGQQVPVQAPTTRMGEVLQACKCAYCRRQNRRGCRGCRIQTGREVAALAELWRTHE